MGKTSFKKNISTFSVLRSSAWSPNIPKPLDWNLLVFVCSRSPPCTWCWGCVVVLRRGRRSLTPPPRRTSTRERRSSSLCSSTTRWDTWTYLFFIWDKRELFYWKQKPLPRADRFSLRQVDENGKIHRLRRECPADECGAGVFMASHFDRHYCGKCCLTYCFNKPEDKWKDVQ